MTTSRTRFVCSRLALGLFGLLLASGCGETITTGSVSGTVAGSRAGARARTPIVSGRIHFYHPELKKAISAPIGPGGVYVVRDVPVGPVKVLIEGTPTDTDPGLARNRAAKTGFRVPHNYAALSSTPLHFDVKEGHQKYDIVVEAPPAWAGR